VRLWSGDSTKTVVITVTMPMTRRPRWRRPKAGAGLPACVSSPAWLATAGDRRGPRVPPVAGDHVLTTYGCPPGCGSALVWRSGVPAA